MTTELQEPVENQKNQESESIKASPSYFKVTIANFVCPGYGAWTLGFKQRGFLIFIVLMAFLVVYVFEVKGQIEEQSKQLQAAMRTQNAHKIEQVITNLTTILLKNINLKCFFYGYLFSMVDSIFLVYNIKKKRKE